MSDLHHHQIQEQNHNFNDFDNNSDKTTTGTGKIRPEFLDFESNSLDYRILNNANQTTNNVHDNIKMRSKASNHNKQQQQQSHEYRHSGSDFTSNGPTIMSSAASACASASNHISTANNCNSTSTNGPNEYSPLSDHNASSTLTRGSATLNKFRNSRNHIITDTIPGPESCV